MMLTAHVEYTWAIHRMCVTAAFLLLVCPAAYADASALPRRSLYAVNESAHNRGAISVYDIDAGHRLTRTIQTVPGVADVRGIAGSAVSGRLYGTTTRRVQE